jgi:hypothetical protein
MEHQQQLQPQQSHQLEHEPVHHHTEQVKSKAGEASAVALGKIPFWQDFDGSYDKHFTLSSKK